MPRSGNEQLWLHAVGEHWPWVRIDAAGRVIDEGRLDPDRPEWPSRQSLTVLVDAARCSGLTVDLPELSPARLRQALRWAAEDQLAGSAESEHVVAGPRADDGRLHCVVIGAGEMDELAACLSGQPAERMLPDALCLPWQPGQVSLAADDEDAILARWGEWSFGRFDPALLHETLDALGDEGAEWVWHAGRPPEWLAERDVRDVSAGRPLLAVLAGQSRLPAVNLLSDRWAPRSAARARTGWRLAGGLAVAVAVLVLAGAGLENHLLKRHSAALDEAIGAQFAEAFPEVGRMVRPMEQGERELARMRFGQAAGFLDLISRVAPVIDGQEQLGLEALDYRDGTLEVSLEAPDVAALDQLERRLAALNLDAEVQSANLGRDGASGRIRIAGAGR